MGGIEEGVMKYSVLHHGNNSSLNTCDIEDAIRKTQTRAYVLVKRLEVSFRKDFLWVKTENKLSLFLNGPFLSFW